MHERLSTLGGFRGTKRAPALKERLHCQSYSRNVPAQLPYFGDGLEPTRPRLDEERTMRNDLWLCAAGLWSLASACRVPVVREATRCSISGRLVYFKNGGPVGRAELLACPPEFAGSACRGSPVVYREKTDKEGHFRFVGVAPSPLVIVVADLDADECAGPFIPEGHLVDNAQCDAGRNFALGTLEHCVLFEMPPPLP